MKMLRKFQIIDTTLRDGEQSAGIVFSIEERLKIVTDLNRAGVTWIEAGTPAMGKEEQETLRELLALPLQSTLIAWNRAEIEDISASLGCGFSCIHISLPISDLHITHKLRKDRKWIIERLTTVIQFVRSHGCSVIVGAEDASRADPEFFLRFADTAAKLGALRIRYADTVGCLDPFTTFHCLSNLVKRSSLPIEFHGHNDFGLATANTLAAFHAGTEFASVTVTGIGERAGNASLEEVTTVLRQLYSYDCGIGQEELVKLATFVSQASGRILFPYKPVVGSLLKLRS